MESSRFHSDDLCFGEEVTLWTLIYLRGGHNIRLGWREGFLHSCLCLSWEKRPGVEARWGWESPGVGLKSVVGSRETVVGSPGTSLSALLPYCSIESLSPLSLTPDPPSYTPSKDGNHGNQAPDWRLLINAEQCHQEPADFGWASEYTPAPPHSQHTQRCCGESTVTWFRVCVIPSCLMFELQCSKPRSCRPSAS